MNCTLPQHSVIIRQLKGGLQILLLVLLLAFHSIGQTIPDSIRVEWSYAGVQSWRLDTTNVADVKNFGAKGDGTTNDYTAIVNAINSLNGRSGIVFFPAGNYRINASINLPDSVTLKGEGAGLTTLTFNLGGATGNCINVSGGRSNTFQNVDSGYKKGSFVLYTSNASSFAKNDYIELREDNGSWDAVPVSWAENSVGQILKVDSISANTIHLEHALRIDYDASLNVQIQKINPRKNVGIECLKITRTDGTTTGVNFMVYFNYAANCRMKGVESDHSIGAHVWSEASTAIEISGCYFHDAYKYDGAGTNGYGVGFAVHTGECKVENNIFKHLRHSMMVKQGANGNMFTYNYSIEPNRSEFPADAGADISVHGHYPFANLFEGNICQTLMIDTTWGPSGPYNTFFRNRIELYGILMSNASVTSDRQNFVGNDITNTTILHGFYLLAGSGHFVYGNNVQGTINPSGTSLLPDSTYYLSSKPSFWKIASPWPNIGTPYNVALETLPARERYLVNDFTVCQDYLTTALTGSSKQNEDIQVFPNPFTNELNFSNNSENQTVTITIYNALGMLVPDQMITKTGAPTIKLNTDRLSNGFYFVSVFSGNLRRTFKCIKTSSGF